MIQESIISIIYINFDAAIFDETFDCLIGYFFRIIFLMEAKDNISFHNIISKNI